MYIISFSLMSHSKRFRSCFDDEEIKNKKLTGLPKIIIASILADAFLSITSLVIGILGLLGIIPGLPPAASFTFIGLSAAIIFAWINMTMLKNGENVKLAKILLQASISSDPERYLPT